MVSPMLQSSLQPSNVYYHNLQILKYGVEGVSAEAGRAGCKIDLT
jgi:hypothetical protein